MLEYLLMQQISDNPLPWRVERRAEKGWIPEVVASNGHIIAYFQSQKEALEIIRMAQRICDENGLLVF